jgi:hypothetical protein
MRHLPKHRRLGEVIGNDATEGAENLLTVFDGQGEPQEARLGRAG